MNIITLLAMLTNPADVRLVDMVTVPEVPKALVVTFSQPCHWWWIDDPVVRLRPSDFVKCMTNPSECCTGCWDIDRDGDVDLRDFATMSNCISGGLP